MADKNLSNSIVTHNYYTNLGCNIDAFIDLLKVHAQYLIATKGPIIKQLNQQFVIVKIHEIEIIKNNDPDVYAHALVNVST